MSLPTGNASGLKGTGFNLVRTGSKDPMQQDIASRLYGGSKQGISSGTDWLSKIAGGDEATFDKMEAPAFRQFGEMQGNLASRFSGLGSGTRRSGAFQRASQGQSTDLAERLQSNRMGLQQSAVSQLNNIASMLLGQQNFENNLIPKKQSSLMQMLAALSGGASQGLGSLGTMWGAKNIFGLGGKDG